MSSQKRQKIIPSAGGMANGHDHEILGSGFGHMEPPCRE